MHPEQQLLETLKAEDYYQNLRVLDDGTIVGTGKLMYTTAIYIGLTSTGFERRYCYQDLAALKTSLQSLKTIDDEPQGWIAKRGC
jgi:hypothetical protein